jgi:cephalosporin-C deacetylase-like acetyl esterase
MMLRLMRALQFVKSLPEWNGRDLIVTGTSQGGMQAVAAAALDQDVTRCEASKAWCADLAGISLERTPGWRPDLLQGILYYDTASMGKRVSCEVSLISGLGDDVCRPSGLTVLYNQIPSSKKTITYIQGNGHEAAPPKAFKQILSQP